MTTTNDRQRPTIALLLYEDLPDDFESGLAEQLSCEDYTFDVLRIPRGPFAGLELYLPAAVGLFIASSYFGGIISKIGEEHYSALKEAAKRLWTQSSQLRIGMTGTPGKLAAAPKFSVVYSITGEVEPNVSFKLLLRCDILGAEAEEAINTFLDMLRDLHAGLLSEDDLAALLTYRPIGGTALVTFNPKTKKIVAVNGLDHS
ncbi:hypothetical protein GCM10023219_32410 [Stakelama sediminis]|uniref:Uncharacterized protein n=1 Tax=Stakelama sediminis TaxID=463200 RepID=A0A840Z1B4_9SPHN|nr:hypothetical protein [Stakelama sediminis]MBB5719567.1 hypothetical protein [Stakelama sediminis]